MDWHGFWYGADYLPLYLIALRAVTIYLAIVAATRVMRFRHVGIMAKHNYLVAAGVVGIAGSRILNPSSSLVLGLAAIAFFTVLGMAFSYLDLKIRRNQWLNPVPLIRYGEIQKKHLRNANMTLDNLLGQLRLNGVFDFRGAQSAYLEATGKVSIIKKSEAQGLCREQLDLPEKLAYPPVELIYDGQVIQENLRQLDLDNHWLEKELQKQGFASPRRVFFAALLPDGTLYACSH